MARSPQRIGNVLAQLMARRGYGRLEAPAQIAAAWQEALGSDMAKHTRPGNVRRGVLEVFVRNSSVVQELMFRKRELLQSLAERLPDQPIRDLRFRVGTVD